MSTGRTSAGPANGVTGGRGSPRPVRIRHEARTQLSVAAVSLVGSVATTAIVWALLRWLG